MPVILDQFGGLIPRSHGRALPDRAASVALDVDLSGGSLKPLAVSSPFVQMHDGTNQKAGVPTGDVVTIPKPDAPSVNLIEYRAKPQYWPLRIWAYDWVAYIDATGARQVIQARGEQLTLSHYVYTETGMWVIAYLPTRTYTFQYGGPYFLMGPRYQFIITDDSDSLNIYGGPDITHTLPELPTEADPEYQRRAAPLIDSHGNVYAQWECIDVMGPQYDETIFVPDYDYVTYAAPAYGNGRVAFHINLHYAIPNRRHFYYVQSMVDADDREGPPSALSERIILRPGQVLTLDTPFESGYTKNMLYRSTTGHDDFLRVAAINAATYTDEKVDLENIEIPPYGNHPGTKTPFLRGSIVHPAQFAMALDTQTAGDETLYVSDFFRFWAWPDEWTIPFDDGYALALSGNTAIVWTRRESGTVSGEVYAVTGGNPEHMGKTLLSADHPILSKTSICRIGNTVFYATYDGLAAVSGGGIEIVTRGHFTRAQWVALDPATMQCKTADNSIFITVSGADDLRLDFDDQLRSVTRYTSTSAGSYTWRSKTFWSKDPVAFDWAIVVADGAVTLTIYADGVQVYTGTVNNANPVDLGGLAHARDWAFEISGANACTRCEFYERAVQTITDEARLTSQTSPVWRATRLKFLDRDRFCVGSLSIQTSDDVDIAFYADGSLAHTETVSSGRVFTLPRDLALGTHWIIDINSAAYIDELWLLRRQTVTVGDTIRETSGGAFPPWLARRYEFPDTKRLRSIIVHATDYDGLTLNLYADGAATPTQTITVSNANEIRLTEQAYSAIEFDFGGDDDRVTEVIAYASPAQPVGPEGIFLTNPPAARGLLYRFAEPHAFACYVVGCSSYDDVTLTLYADGVQVYQAAVTSPEAVQLPRDLDRGLTWEVDVATPAEVQSLVLVPWRRVVTPEIAVQTVSGQGTIPEWFYTLYEFNTRVTIRSGRVKAYGYSALSLRLYANGATTPTETVNLSDAYEWRLADADVVPCETLSFDFSDNSEVTEVMLFNEETIPVEGPGVLIRQASGRPWRNKVLSFREMGSWDVARVVASDYTGATLKLYADGSQQESIAPDDSDDIKIDPGSACYRDWQLDLAHQGDIREVHLIARTAYSVGANGIVIIRREGDPWSWLQRRIICARPVNFAALRVLASSTVTVRLYAGGTLRATLAAASGDPVRVGKVRSERDWVIDVVPSSATGQVQEVALATSMEGLRA